jgi:hypothetical protein
MKPLVYLMLVLTCASRAGAQAPAARQGRPKPPARVARPPQPVRLLPQFVPGRVFRYEMDFRTTTESHHTGLVEDPQAASQLEISWSAVVRVDVLGVEPAPVSPAPGPSGAAGFGHARLRTTYEKVAATARSDAYDPEAAAIAEQYRKLEGRSVTFTLGADGKVSDVAGLEDIVADPRAAEAARQWLAQLAVGASAPEQGIVPGQKWSSEMPANSAPLAGLFWRTESNYLRDEPCRSLADLGTGVTPAPGDSSFTENCAVILTRFEIVQPRPQRDPTPEDYRKRGLRTSGKWNGSGESLSYISLRSGWVVSITQSGTERMDVTVSTADGESSVHYAGQVRSQSQITLLPEPSTPAR